MDEQITQERLGSLASEVALAAERERRRIAIGLHDRISQSLALAKMKLDSIRQHTAARNRPVVDEVIALLEQTLDETRTLTFELSPPILYELGLLPALQWLAEQTQKRHHIRVIVDGNCPSDTLSSDLRVMLFQAVRELLINVAKHAKATTARVTCRVVDRQVRVMVIDDGEGFDPARLSTYGPGHAGFGLFSIRNHLEQLNGRFEIFTAVGHGTRVTLSTPVIEASKAPQGENHAHENSAGGRPPDRPGRAPQPPSTT
jgi:signal transduction histidine kinase